MAAWKLTGVLTDGASAGLSRTKVAAVLVDPGTGKERRGWTSDGQIVRGVQEHVAGEPVELSDPPAGTWDLELAATADVTPPGSGWAIYADGKPLGVVSKAAADEAWEDVTILAGAPPMTPAELQSAIDRGVVASSAAVTAVDQRIDTLGPGDVGADPAGTAASEAAGRVSTAGDTMSGDLDVDGAELRLLNPTIAGGMIDGAVIRRVHSARSVADYTQTVPPLDELVQPGFRTNWRGSLSDDGGGFGPNPGYAGPDGFGPPAVYDLSGLVSWGANGSPFSFTPIGFGTVMRVRNSPGVPRTMAHGWGFMYAQALYADAATVTLQTTDTNRGGSAFVDNQVWSTANGGTLDGVTNNVEMTGFLSIPAVIGNSHIARRVAFDCFDLNGHNNNPMTPTPGAVEQIISDQGWIGGQDLVGGGTVDEQVAVRIPRLVGAVLNIGTQNGSRTVLTPALVTVASAAAVCPVDVSMVGLNNSTGATVTLSTPLGAGVAGQTLILAGTGTHDVVVDGVTVPAAGAVELVYIGGSWRQAAATRAEVQSAPRRKAKAMDGASTAPSTPAGVLTLPAGSVPIGATLTARWAGVISATGAVTPTLGMFMFVGQPVFLPNMSVNIPAMANGQHVQFEIEATFHNVSSTRYVGTVKATTTVPEAGTAGNNVAGVVGLSKLATNEASGFDLAGAISPHVVVLGANSTITVRVADAKLTGP